MAKEKKQKGSETIEILRSQIALNPKNPKHHSDEQIKSQVKNIRKNGYLGGIIWNGVTGCLVDGHRRVMALDIIHKYDGTPETDYTVKVEKVEFDKKTELEQLTYSALGNSKADYNLVSQYIGEIDYRDAGISEEDYAKIMELSPAAAEVGMRSFDDEFLTPYEPTVELEDTDEKSVDDIIKEHEEKPKMTKEQVKAEKKKCDDVASNRQENQDLYVFLSFETLEDKFTFCELLGEVPTNSMMVSGRRVLNLID